MAAASTDVRFSAMAEVQPEVATIEINDAIFCQHFKEVVRLYIVLVCLVSSLMRGSALNATMMGGRRMMRSSGYVLRRRLDKAWSSCRVV